MPNLKYKLNYNEYKILIEELPPEFVKVMLLYHFENMKENEIAKHLNKSIYFVHSRISKGNYLVKKKMNDSKLIEAHRIIYGKESEGC